MIGNVLNPAIRFVVMAKLPRPGRVKSRLVADGLSPDDAASLAEAMLQCIIARLASRGEVILAVTPDDSFERFPLTVRRLVTGSVNQGEGDLGARLDRVWRAVGNAQPIAFFGIDSPDVPDTAFKRISTALADHDLAVGPTDDGGYWTLASNVYRPAVLRDIDWGTASVYDATRERAKEAGLTVAEIPAWSDVDRAADLVALRARLRQAVADLNPPLRTLLARLESLPMQQREQDTHGTRRTDHD